LKSGATTGAATFTGMSAAYTGAIQNAANAALAIKNFFTARFLLARTLMALALISEFPAKRAKRMLFITVPRIQKRNFSRSGMNEYVRNILFPEFVSLLLAGHS
jgi:hypothetical protein